MVNIRLIKKKQKFIEYFVNLALLAKNNFIILFLRLLPVMTSLLAIPIILKQLGNESFGVYSLYFTFVSLSTILDFGYVNMNMYKFQDAYLDSNFYLARSASKKFQKDLLKIAGLQSILFVFIGLLVAAISLYYLEFNVKQDFVLAGLILLCLTPFHVLQNFINRTLICMNKHHEALFFNSLSLIFVSATLVIVSHYTSSIALLIFVSTFLPLCIFIYQLIRLNKQLSLRIDNSIDSKINIPKSVLSRNFTIIQVFAFLSLWMDPFLIALFVTSETIAEFAIVSKIIVLLVSITSWVQITQLNLTRQFVLNKEFFKLSQNWYGYLRNWIFVSIFSVPILSFMLEIFIKIWTDGLIDITFLGSLIAVSWAHLMVLSNYSYQIIYSLGDHRLGRNAIVLTVLLKIFLTTIMIPVVHEFWVPLLSMSLSIIAIYIPITVFALRKNKSQ